MSAQILLVDDDPKVLEIIGVSLGRRGYRVQTATTGREAVEHAVSGKTELVILDLALPDMTGLDVLEQVRGRGHDHLPVMFLSAETDLDARLRAFDAGADDFLHKPVALRELHAKIEGLLRRVSRMRALGRDNQSLQDEVTSSHERATKDFKRHLLSMRTLLSVSHDLNHLRSEDLVKLASLTLLGELKVSSMAIFALERENGREFSLHGVKGFDARRFEGLSIDRTSPFVAQIAEDQRPQKIARNADPRWLRSLPDLRLAVFEYATPITLKNETKGVIFTGPKLSGDDYTEQDRDMMTFIANSVGIGMQNASLLNQLQTTYVVTMRSLISVIEAKHPYTAGHTERVAAYSMAIANGLGLSDEERRQIAFGALLHDVGKMGIVDDIINKPGALTDEEWALMRAHPEVGARIVEKMEFLTGTVDIVRHHHESWNGKGYPGGLAGDAIPYFARIVTVADSFDAMTTDRPYRAALTLEEAIDRLEKGAGQQFDASLVPVFVSYIREKGLGDAPTVLPDRPAL